MLYSLANMDKSALGALQGLEKNVGKTVLAFTGKEFKPAQLDQSQLSQLQELEKKLGLTLVAVS